MTDKYLTITEAASKFGLTRQGIYAAIKNKRLTAEFISNKWMLTEKNWTDYINSKFNRLLSKHNGRYIYSKENGIVSPSMVSKFYKVEVHRIYNLIRQGYIPYKRLGVAYILSMDDVERNKERICVPKFIRQKPMI